MRVLIINKFLYPNGGSETYIFKLGEALEQHGHEVQYFGMEHEGRCVGNRVNAYTSDMDFHGGSKLSKLTYPIKTIYSKESRVQLRKVLDDFKPDVCHLNNFNYQLTPSIILEIVKWRKETGRECKIIFTAHDYQLVCPNHIQWFAAKYANAHDVFFVGRGIDYAVCLEGSLKLKEISYIHSEAYAAGELKHGTISLIEQGTLVIGVLTQSELYEKTISNMLECKSRGAYLMGLTTYGKYEIEDQVNFTVYVPKVDEHFVGSLAVIPLQLLGYYVSVAKGLDVDKPRNLAKSVTVE